MGPSGGTHPAALHAALSSLLGLQLTGGRTLPAARQVARPHWAVLDNDGAAFEDQLHDLLRGERLGTCPIHYLISQCGTTHATRLTFLPLFHNESRCVMEHYNSR